MSDNHHSLIRVHPLGEINHSHSLVDNFGSLCMSEDYSDVTLIVDNHKIAAHRVILASRSNYFRALLFGGLRESRESTIELKSTSLAPFKLLLKYIYCGQLSLKSLKEDLIIEILGISNKYGFKDLEEAISDYMEDTLNVKNVCSVYEAAKLYGLTSLCKVCTTFIDRNAIDIMQHDYFMTLSPSSLKDMISRDSFCAEEIKIFKAVKDWVEANPTADHEEIISCIRLPLINIKDLLGVVRPTKLVNPDLLLDAIDVIQKSKGVDLKYRGYLMPEENVATPEHEAVVLIGEMKSALLDGDVENYDMEKGFTRHHIDDNDCQGILIELGVQCIINHIRMLLWDKDVRAYSYYIEVSMDQVDWVRIVDHTHYHCRSWQRLFFAPRVVKYIRIVGTHNTVNRVFHCVSFECMYTDQPFNLDSSGLIIPDYNVASIAHFSNVIEGVSRSRNTLINGDWTKYDWDTGYTCHQLGSGAIVVQLAQPYLIDSMRLLLWDIDDRAYSYYIEVSGDYQNWEMVADCTKEFCKSWQSIKFDRRPVVYIKIVGTNNTANEVFHCVHFECPSQEEAIKSKEESVHNLNPKNEMKEEEEETKSELKSKLN